MLRSLSSRLSLLFGPAAIIALSATLAACGGSSGDGEAPVADPLPAAAGDWMRFVPVAAEIDGKLLTPTCSGFPGTDPQFHFWARRGTAQKLVVFFEEGGACWDDFTCSAADHARSPAGSEAAYKSEILPGDDPRILGGLFDTQDSRNPAGDWSLVYIPYCTGDVHGGSNTAHYVNPFTGQPFTIEHRGADNFGIVMRWIRDNFRSPEQVLVAGSSAGGYGATIHYPAIRDSFPSATAALLADASQAVLPANFGALGHDSWNFRLSTRVWGNDALTVPASEMTSALARHYPGDRVGQYTTSLDLGQMRFYDLMAYGLAGVQGTSCQQWSAAMRTELASRQQVANFRSYLAAGISHTVLRTDLFYTESSAGTPFADWFAAMLSPSGVGWTNQTCTDCDTLPFPCPF